MEGAERLPEFFDLKTRLAFKQRQAFSFIRLGDGRTAEVLFRELIAGYDRLNGPDSAEGLRVRMNLTQALMIQREFAAAIKEADALQEKMVKTLGQSRVKPWVYFRPIAQQISKRPAMRR